MSAPTEDGEQELPVEEGRHWMRAWSRIPIAGQNPAAVEVLGSRLMAATVAADQQQGGTHPCWLHPRPSSSLGLRPFPVPSAQCPVSVLLLVLNT